MTTRFPVLFISHGAPDILLQQDPVLLQWQQQVQSLPIPKNILIVSAHWETSTFKLGGNRTTETIHDFGGFSPRLYDIKYPAISDLEFSNELAKKLQLDTNHERGLDHGSWVPLTMLYPQADVPVTQLSVAPSAGSEAHYKLGQQLEYLRLQGVLIITSGGIVHNLAKLQWEQPFMQPVEWASEFSREFKKRVEQKKWHKLCRPHELTNGQLAVPTTDHYLPFLVAAGAAGCDEAVCFCEEWRYGSLGMHCYSFG